MNNSTEKVNNSINNSNNSINGSNNSIKNCVKGLTACRVPEDSLISRQAAIDEITEYGSGDAIFMSVGELKRRIEHLPSVQPVAKDTNVLNNDTISRQAAIDEIKALYEWHDTVTKDRTIDHLKRLPSVQPEDCGTCKHGYFGDEQCNDCRVRFTSHYERRTDGLY